MSFALCLFDVEKSTSAKLAGVEGFEPPYGGIKTRDMVQRNQQLTELLQWPVPSISPNSPSLPLELPLGLEVAGPA
jgi:hypothetical protein